MSLAQIFSSLQTKKMSAHFTNLCSEDFWVFLDIDRDIFSQRISKIEVNKKCWWFDIVFKNWNLEISTYFPGVRLRAVPPFRRSPSRKSKKMFLFQSHHVYTNHWNHFFPYFVLQFFLLSFFFISLLAPLRFLIYFSLICDADFIVLLHAGPFRCHFCNFSVQVIWRNSFLCSLK